MCSAAAHTSARLRYMPAYAGPPPPSGTTQSMFCEGHLVRVRVRVRLRVRLRIRVKVRVRVRVSVEVRVRVRCSARGT